MMSTQTPHVSEILQDAAKRLSDLVPEGLHSAKHELEKNIHTVLQSMLHKLDLVTREEFDAQVAVLARTRQKLAFLEAELAELSNHIHKEHPQDTE